MDQAIFALNEQTKVKKWLFQDSEDEERRVEHTEELMDEVRQEKWELERQREDLAREKQEFLIQKKMTDRQRQSEEKLFQMKWKMLESELSKLANEKLEVEAQKKLFYDHHRDEPRTADNGLFFAGVSNVLALKKRHRDLTKIYHPDNLAGDTGVIQEINREYEELKKVYQ